MFHDPACKFTVWNWRVFKAYFLIEISLLIKIVLFSDWTIVIYIYINNEWLMNWVRYLVKENFIVCSYNLLFKFSDISTEQLIGYFSKCLSYIPASGIILLLLFCFVLMKPLIVYEVLLIKWYFIKLGIFFLCRW